MSFTVSTVNQSYRLYAGNSAYSINASNYLSHIHLYIYIVSHSRQYSRQYRLPAAMLATAAAAANWILLVFGSEETEFFSFRRDTVHRHGNADDFRHASRLLTRKSPRSPTTAKMNVSLSLVSQVNERIIFLARHAAECLLANTDAQRTLDGLVAVYISSTTCRTTSPNSSPTDANYSPTTIQFVPVFLL